MTTSDDTDNSEPRASGRPWQQWLPGVLAFLGLMGVAWLGQLANRNLWWFRGQYELLDLIIAAAVTLALCVGVLTLIRVMHPNQDIELFRKIAATTFFAGIGIKAGLRYVHLCSAGSRWIEGLAILATPVLVGLILFACKRRLLGYALAICVVTTVWFLARPYLDWAHGN